MGLSATTPHPRSMYFPLQTPTDGKNLPLQNLAPLVRLRLDTWCAEKANEANDIGSRFGRRLRRLRLERQMTQCDMAKRFGIDRSFISDVERGRKSMTLPMLEVIAIGMDLTLSKLFEDI